MMLMVDDDGGKGTTTLGQEQEGPYRIAVGGRVLHELPDVPVCRLRLETDGLAHCVRSGEADELGELAAKLVHGEWRRARVSRPRIAAPSCPGVAMRTLGRKV